MESRFDADCNLCCRRGDWRVAHDPRDKIRDAATERAATGNALCGGSLACTLASHARAGPEAEADCAAGDNELRNLYALNLREIDGILDRAQDRMNPILRPDQQQRLRQMVEERKQHLEQ